MIAQLLKESRKESGLTQEQVASSIHVSRQSISNWENGKTYPDIVSVIALSDLYNVSLDQLLKGDPKMIKHIEETTDLTASNKKLIILHIAMIILLLVTIVLSVLDIKNSLLIYGTVAILFSLVLIAGLEIIERI